MSVVTCLEEWCQSAQSSERNPLLSKYPLHLEGGILKCGALVQDCQREVGTVGAPIIPDSPAAIHALVTAMTHEWEVATYNAQVAAAGRAGGAAVPRPPGVGSGAPSPGGPQPMVVDGE